MDICDQLFIRNLIKWQNTNVITSNCLIYNCITCSSREGVNFLPLFNYLGRVTDEVNHFPSPHRPLLPTQVTESQNTYNITGKIIYPNDILTAIQ